MTSNPPAARFIIAGPRPFGADGGGALGVIQVTADSGEALDRALLAIDLPRIAPGQVTLRRVLGVDDAVIARFNERMVCITPHGGSLVLRLLAEALERRGLEHADPARLDPREIYPEAEDLAEACALDAIARAASPLAIDALLRQPALWRAHWLTPRCSAEAIGTHTAVMNRLIEPPMVAAVGPPSVGKSTLVNALARRAVSLVAEAPGTTRDHVGVTLDVAGLVVRWIDTPGLTPASIESAQRGASTADDFNQLEIEAARAALAVIRAADLIVLCGDHRAGWLDPRHLPLGSGAAIVRCRLRADLDRECAELPGTIMTAAAHAHGLTDLATAVRQTLITDVALHSCTPWAFHTLLPQEIPESAVRPPPDAGHRVGFRGASTPAILDDPLG